MPDVTEPLRHSLLRRQIRRFFRGPENVPEIAHEFVDAVDEAYRQFDVDRLMLERTLELSSNELLQTNTDLRAVLEGLVDWFLRVDREGQILDYRRGKGTALDLPEPLTGKRIQEIHELGGPGGIPEAIERAAEGGEQVLIELDREFGGRERHLHATLLPVHHEQLIVVIQDRSEQRAAAVREKALSARLARSQRLESLGILAGGVAHDLNNILGPLVGYPDLMLEELPPGSPVYEDLVTIRNSGLRAAAVIRDLLTLARRGSHRTEPVDLNEIVREFSGSPVWRELVANRDDLEIGVDLADQVLPVMTSQHHLAQTFLNLMLNACEAIEGPGSVSIRTERRYLDHPVTGYDNVAEGEYVVLRVQDTGRGIEKADLEHIFEPFYTKKKMGRSGTGLGLSVVYACVKDADGYVDVRTDPGSGSEFILYFPAAGLAEVDPETEASVPGGGERILVVDDVPEQREIAARLLESLGYRVATAATGLAALEELRRETYDLVVLDMIMEEGWDGLETFKAIIEACPGQRCLIASGFAENAKVRAAQRLGAGAYLQKPYTVDNLGRAVRAELGRVEAGRA